MIHEAVMFKSSCQTGLGEHFFLIAQLMNHFMLPAEEIGGLHEWQQLPDKWDHHPERLILLDVEQD